MSWVRLEINIPVGYSHRQGTSNLVTITWNQVFSLPWSNNTHRAIFEWILAWAHCSSRSGN